MPTGPENPEPTFLTAPPSQPPADSRLREVAVEIRGSLDKAARYLVALPPYATDLEKSVWMWHTALTTLAWDVSEITIAAAADSPSLRAARALNRMLVDYAARVHLYLVDPALAETHASEAINMLRRVMKPVAANPTDDPGVEAVKALVESGTTKANQPRTREMLAALVANFIDDPAKREQYVDFLDAEYAMGSAYVHGSQASFFDLFDANNGKLHPRTRVLHRRDELLRCATSMLALLVGIEMQYDQDFGVRRHVDALHALGPFGSETSMGTHDTLRALLGIQ